MDCIEGSVMFLISGGESIHVSSNSISRISYIHRVRVWVTHQAPLCLYYDDAGSMSRQTTYDRFFRTRSSRLYVFLLLLVGF
jgi:hypothetical protein